MRIKGISDNRNRRGRKIPGVVVFHAGTAIQGETLNTAGGRVLGVSAVGDTLKQALDHAYEAVELINFEGKYFPPGYWRQSAALGVYNHRMPPRMTEQAHSATIEKFKSPEEELAYLRQRVSEKERELDVPKNRIESDRIAKREIAEYATIPTATIIHETVVMPEHETLRHALNLDPEKDDVQMDGLLRIVAERGIRNALSVSARMKNSHLEDDFHRMLVRYIAEGLPEKGFSPPEKSKARAPYGAFRDSTAGARRKG